VGSDRAKPDNLLEVAVGGDAEFLAPLPLRALPLVGPRFGAVLAALDVHTIGDATKLDRVWLERRFGKPGLLLAERARGIDSTPVVAGKRSARSISREITFGEDVIEFDELIRTLRIHAERVGFDLRTQEQRARTIILKLRWSDFTTLTRSRTVSRPVQLTEELAGIGYELLDELLAREPLRPVRLIGLGATNLVEDAVQLRFDEEVAQRAANVDRALDEIRGRYGASAVTRGTKPHVR
jgi:DNA polymerase-4